MKLELTILLLGFKMSYYIYYIENVFLIIGINAIYQGFLNGFIAFIMTLSQYVFLIIGTNAICQGVLNRLWHLSEYIDGLTE